MAPWNANVSKLDRGMRNAAGIYQVRMALLAALEDAGASAQPGPAEIVDAVRAWVTRNIRYVPEAVEVYEAPVDVLQYRGADCDGHVALVGAMLLSGGVRVRLAYLAPDGGDPDHVVAQAWLGSWVSVETTPGDSSAHTVCRLGGGGPCLSAASALQGLQGAPGRGPSPQDGAEIADGLVDALMTAQEDAEAEGIELLRQNLAELWDKALEALDSWIPGLGGFIGAAAGLLNDFYEMAAGSPGEAAREAARKLSRAYYDALDSAIIILGRRLVASWGGLDLLDRLETVPDYESFDTITEPSPLPGAPAWYRAIRSGAAVSTFWDELARHPGRADYFELEQPGFPYYGFPDVGGDPTVGEGREPVPGITPGGPRYQQRAIAGSTPVATLAQHRWEDWIRSWIEDAAIAVVGDPPEFLPVPPELLEAAVVRFGQDGIEWQLGITEPQLGRLAVLSMLLTGPRSMRQEAGRLWWARALRGGVVPPGEAGQDFHVQHPAQAGDSDYRRRRGVKKEGRTITHRKKPQPDDDGGSILSWVVGGAAVAGGALWWSRRSA